MRFLLDECVPKRLAKALEGHAVERVQQLGWSGIRNGRLLELAAGAYDAFITVDQKIEHEQNLDHLPIAVVIIVARSNRYADLAPLVPELLNLLKRLAPRTLAHVGLRQ